MAGDYYWLSKRRIANLNKVNQGETIPATHYSIFLSIYFASIYLHLSIIRRAPIRNITVIILRRVATTPVSYRTMTLEPGLI